MRQLVGLFLFLAATVFGASNTQVTPVAAYEVSEPGRAPLYLIGRDGAGKILVYRIQGRSRVVMMAGPAGDLSDISLNDGSRLVVPSVGGRLGTRVFPFGPSLVHRNKPRQAMAPINLTKEVFERYGILDMIAPEFFAEKRAIQVSEPVFLRNPGTAEMLIVTPKKDSSWFSSSSLERFDTLLQRFPGQLANGGSRSFQMLFVDPQIYPIVSESLKEFREPALDVELLPAKLVPALQFEVNEVSAWIPELSRGPLHHRISIARRLAQVSTLTHLHALTETDKNALVRTLRDLIETLKEMGEGVQRLAEAEVRAKLLRESDITIRQFEEMVFRAVLTHPLYVRFAEPLRALELEIFELFHRLGTPYAHEAVIHDSLSSNGAGLSLMRWNFDYTLDRRRYGHYLDYWLDWMRAIIFDASSRPPLLSNQEMPNWRVERREGTFEHLGVSRVNLLMTNLDANAIASHWDIETMASAPLVLLGLAKDERRAHAQRAITQFIIDVDAKFQEQLAIENKRRDNRSQSEDYKASELLNIFLGKLVSPPRAFMTFEGYDELTYYSGVLEIIAELLATSETVLHTRGTHELLMERGLALGLNYKDIPSLAFSATFANRASRLREMIYQKIARGAAIADRHHQAATCIAVIMDPHPSAAARTL